MSAHPGFLSIRSYRQDQPVCSVISYRPLGSPCHGDASGLVVTSEHRAVEGLDQAILFVEPVHPEHEGGGCIRIALIAQGFPDGQASGKNIDGIGPVSVTGLALYWPAVLARDLSVGASMARDAVRV